MCRQRRLGAHLAALTLQTVEQGGLFAADVGAGTDNLLDVEGKAGAKDVGAEQLGRAGGGEGCVEDANGDRVFRAGVDIALGSADREGGDDHAFDQGKRIAFHQHAVGEGAGIAFIGIADDEFARAGGLIGGAPFDASGKTGAAAAAQFGHADRRDGLLRANLEGAAKALQAAMRFVFADGERIGDAAAGEDETPLGGKER